MGLTRQQALWLIPAALAVHNLEEAATFLSYWPVVRVSLPAMFRPMASVDTADFRVALIWATLLPIAVLCWVTWRPDAVAARWSALAVQATVALNVISHLVVAGIFVRGYSPGLFSAVLINAPVSVYLFHRAARESWVSGRARGLLLPAALFIHGPGVLTLLLLSRH